MNLGRSMLEPAGMGADQWCAALLSGFPKTCRSQQPTKSKKTTWDMFVINSQRCQIHAWQIVALLPTSVSLSFIWSIPPSNWQEKKPHTKQTSWITCPGFPENYRHGGTCDTYMIVTTPQLIICLHPWIKQATSPVIIHMY